VPTGGSTGDHSPLDYTTARPGVESGGVKGYGKGKEEIAFKTDRKFVRLPASLENAEKGGAPESPVAKNQPVQIGTKGNVKRRLTGSPGDLSIRAPVGGSGCTGLCWKEDGTSTFKIKNTGGGPRFRSNRKGFRTGKKNHKNRIGKFSKSPGQILRTLQEKEAARNVERGKKTTHVQWDVPSRGRTSPKAGGRGGGRR